MTGRKRPSAEMAWPIMCRCWAMAFEGGREGGREGWVREGRDGGREGWVNDGAEESFSRTGLADHVPVLSDGLRRREGGREGGKEGRLVQVVEDCWEREGRREGGAVVCLPLERGPCGGLWERGASRTA